MSTVATARISTPRQPNTRRRSRVVRTQVVSTRAVTRPARRRRVRAMSRGAPPFHDYRQCLVNPFCCQPTYAPIPTAVATFLARAVIRTTISTNTDGTFSAFLMPTLQVSGTTAGLFTNVSGAAGTTWNSQSWSNHGVLVNAFATGRVVSFGLKVTANIPATSAPGFLYSGGIPGLPYSALTAISPNASMTFPVLKISEGRRGAFALGRPEDMESYHFHINTHTMSTSQTPLFTVPWITGVGFPSSSAVVVEAVVNFEALPPASATYVIDSAPDSTMANRPTMEPSHALTVARQTLAVASGALDSLGSVAGAITTGAQSLVNHTVRAAQGVLSPLTSTYNQQMAAQRTRY